MKKWGALITLSLAMFIIVIDTTIMNVSISALVTDLNTTVSGVQSAISVYALVMAASILIGAKLSDIFGKKRIFFVGLIIYAVGTTTASFSNSLGVLIFGWSFLEGVGGALMIPNIQVLLRGEYEGGDLAFAYGIIGAVGAIGAAVGPIVGGFFTTFYSWRWAFRTELVIVIIVIALTRYLQPDEPVDERPRFDFVGAGLSILGWSGIVLGILLAQQYGFFLAKQPFVIAGLAFAPLGLSITPLLVGAGILFIVMLFQWESRREAAGQSALFRPSIFRAEGITAGFGVRFVQVGITAAFLYVLPLMLQLSFEYTAMETGVALMPFSLSLLFMAILGSRLSARFVAKRIIQVGFVVAIAGLVSMAVTIQPDTTAGELALGALFGAGVGLIASQILNLILSSVKEDLTAETAGLSSTFEQLGNAIGVALVGTVMLGALSVNLQNGIGSSTAVPDEARGPLIAAVEQGVQLMSDGQIEQALQTAGATASVESEVLQIYGVARTAAFKAGVGVMIFAALLGTVFTVGLASRKLVDAETQLAAQSP